MKLEIKEIISAVGGRLLQEPAPASPVYITNISTDTRTIQAGALFVPIAGENFDGHDFIGQATEKGAICALTERHSTPNDTPVPLIYVSSTRRALMDLADFYRRSHNVKVVAVAGSAGKTTTKEMIAAICAQKFNTKRTIKNFNNNIGMPLSIFQLEPDDEVLVLEMGMDRPGEVHELSLAAVPDIAVITHIGDEHMENFTDRAGVLLANLEIVDGLRTGGTVVLNGDDELLTGPVAAEKTAPYNALFPNSENIVQAEPAGLQETRCVFNWRGEEIRLTVPIPGGHMVMNALLSAVVGLELGVTPEQITAAFAGFTPPTGRLNIFEAKGITVIDDAYNAHPTSMTEALKVLCRETTRRRVAILGDMLELGHTAAARHREAGEFAAAAGVEMLIAVGPLSRGIYDAFVTASRASKNNALYFETPDKLLESLHTHLSTGDIVLIKASRGMQLERVVEAFSSG